jgi:hypothetical protein
MANVSTYMDSKRTGNFIVVTIIRIAISLSIKTEVSQIKIGQPITIESFIRSMAEQQQVTWQFEQHFKLVKL